MPAFAGRTLLVTYQLAAGANSLWSNDGDVGAYV
jgi:hypothetical protein